MPQIAIVDGAILMMYANDHEPPHFHVLFAEHRAVIDVESLKLDRGGLPRGKLRAVIKWAKPRRAKLIEAWEITQARLVPEKIR